MKKIFSLKILIFVILLEFSSLPFEAIAHAQTPDTGQNRALQAVNPSLDVVVAPGELLPIAVKLSNFGGGKRVDIVVTYTITSEKGIQIYKTNETLAVETTNNFIKTVQIPMNAVPGSYIAKTSIEYPGQEAPATTQFSFRVEQKILGLFQNQFILYGGGTLFLSILMVVIGYSLVKRKNARFSPIDYGNVPHSERVFYELVSDTVFNMRQKVGDRALTIAAKVPGLSINTRTGRVNKLTRSPSKITAELVSEYEKELGKKVSFSFRKPKT